MSTLCFVCLFFHRFSIDKNNVTQMYIIDMAIRFAQFFDEDLPIASGLEIPIPLCNDNFDLVGK